VVSVLSLTTHTELPTDSWLRLLSNKKLLEGQKGKLRRHCLSFVDAH
jgi:hypothetical protein